MNGRGCRLLAVSHPAVVDVNQEVYRELARRDWDVTIVVPRRWEHSYAKTPVAPRALAGLESALRPVPVAFRGRPQRHVYLTSARSLSRRLRPDVAFVEAEAYALAATQWARALARAGVPFGVQCYENIDRPLPAPVQRLRARVLRDATFVAARSDSAARLARAWGARGEIGLAPPAVPAWESLADGNRSAAFTIGYAGRLVESKGLIDLLEAVRTLDAPVQLVLVGNGELREHLDGQPIPGSRVRVLAGFAHDQMASAYCQFDVLVLPSRTTSTWKEQFGRVIVEALWCGVPVVGSDSGEIPWLIELTGGGRVFPEGDCAALAGQLRALRETPALRAELARRGRAAVERLFSVPAATDAFEQLLLAAAPPRQRAQRAEA
ncbi:MAG TPA: glycosyltransferase family 4 protein [Solirubrobacteraceae bacterium]|jgi:glycosyltransferase involved in cell wall biosynthesis|nr:glycosyltransferase family 4 protein [Solirubrobacteraceae bacterium]